MISENLIQFYRMGSGASKAKSGELLKLAHTMWDVVEDKIPYSEFETKLMEVKQKYPDFANIQFLNSEDKSISGEITLMANIIDMWKRQPPEKNDLFCKLLTLLVDNGGRIENPNAFDYKSIIKFAVENKIKAALECIHSLNPLAIQKEITKPQKNYYDRTLEYRLKGKDPEYYEYLQKFKQYKGGRTRKSKLSKHSRRTRSKNRK